MRLIMPKKPLDFHTAIDEILPILEGQQDKYQVTEILGEERYEFFAVPVSPAGFGDILFRGVERTFHGDWGKARDSYEVPGAQVAHRLRIVQTSLQSGSIGLRHFTITFDPDTMYLEDYKFKVKSKIMFIVTFEPFFDTPTVTKASAKKPPTTTGIKYCQGCGAQLEATADFCYRCGKGQ